MRELRALPSAEYQALVDTAASHLSTGWCGKTDHDCAAISRLLAPPDGVLASMTGLRLRGGEAAACRCLKWQLEFYRRRSVRDAAGSNDPREPHTMMLAVLMCERTSV